MYKCMIFAFFATLMFSCLQTGYGFKCWFCNSQVDKRCGDPFNNTDGIRQDECYSAFYGGTGNLRYICRKIKFRGDGNELFVSRSCIQEGFGENDPCSITQLGSLYGKVEHCSTCPTELCNSAPALYQITSAVLGPVIVFLTKINIL